MITAQSAGYDSLWENGGKEFTKVLVGHQEVKFSKSTGFLAMKVKVSGDNVSIAPGSSKSKEYSVFKIYNDPAADDAMVKLSKNII